MNATNAKRFAEVYAVKLTEAIARHPDEYSYEATPDAIAAVVAKMVPAYARGDACDGAAVKATARALGLKVSLGAVKAYLNQPESVT